MLNALNISLIAVLFVAAVSVQALGLADMPTQSGITMHPSEDLARHAFTDR